MVELISTDKLIKQAQAKGINFGRGDPYNRLRYYTKIGWLPHMIRKTDSKGKVKGHYPKWVLKQLLAIEALKSKGFSNDEIAKKIEVRTKLQGISSALLSNETRIQIATYSILALVLFITLSELGILGIGKSKLDIRNFGEIGIEKQILDSGSGFIPRNTKAVFVKNNSIKRNSKIYITFDEDYSPAIRYWVAELQEGRGFKVEMDAPVSKAAGFNWWLSN